MRMGWNEGGGIRGQPLVFMSRSTEMDDMGDGAFCDMPNVC